MTDERFVMKKVIFLLFVAAVHGHFVFCQDILEKTNKSKLEVKIIEIGKDEIKYKNYNDLEGPIYVISKRDVISIRRENGETISFEKDILEVSESKASDKRRAIGVDPFSLLFRHFAIGYQQWIKPGLILEAKAGYIGVGVQPRWDDFDDEKKGAFVTVSSKLLFKQLTYSPGTRIVHPLAGAYFRPQVSFSYFSNKERLYDAVLTPYGYSMQPYDVKFDNYSLALNLTLGKQFLIADALLLDIFVGAGYGYVSRTTKSNIPPVYSEVGTASYFHSHLIVSKEFPMSYTSGVSLALLLK